MLPTTLTLGLPAWVSAVDAPDALAHLADRMELVLGLASENIDRGTGGPFAAAVFEEGSGRLVSVGVNRVVPENSSLAHAEVLAIGLAQAALGTYDLGGTGRPRLQLVCSSQMCAMCLGAVVWSGVTQVVYATTSGDVTATVGFDEGPTPPDYTAQLVHRGISVVAGVMREEGLAVLRRYVASGGVVYNAHH
ncbi:MAG TPA: nucleoside deaminase [Candidatus Limnocylindrales bacterium]|nr:nucleoside deaminase [Candidatus Limnocylindrales bacterium]